MIHFGQPLTSQRVGVGDVLLVEEFTGPGVPRVRQICFRATLAAGLTRHRALMFLYAVDVGLQNAVRCSGRGVLNLVRDGEARLVAEIIDHRRDDTGGSSTAGGLWLAERLVDELTLRSGSDETTVRIATTLNGRGGYPWAGSRHDARLAALIASLLFPADE